MTRSYTNPRDVYRRVAGLLLSLAIIASFVGHSAAPAHALIACNVANPGCPAAADDSYTVDFGKTLTVSTSKGLLVNDHGPAGMKIDLDNTDTESFNGNATLLVRGDGSFTYTPDPGTPFSGTDWFNYGITDVSGDNTASAIAEIKVRAVPHSDSYTVNVNHTLTVAAPGVVKNDLGVDPTSVTFDDFSAKNGDIVDNSDGAFAYTPPHGFVGTDTFQYIVLDLNFEFEYTGTVTVKVVDPNAPPPPPPPPPAVPKGYLMVGSTGKVYAFGQLAKRGDAATSGVTHIEPTPSRKGYWILNSAGTVFAFGDAKKYGPPPTMRANESASSLSSTPTGKGYWIFTNRGRVLRRGDAKFFGDVHKLALNGPIVGSVATPTGKGYYMVASDGGIFAFGDARFFGSMGGAKLNKPVNGIVPTSNNRGYWLVASDGGIFAFGNAGFRGSMGATALNRPVIGMVRYGNGYLMVSSDGGIFAFSNLPFLGSLASNPPSAPIVGVASGG